MNLPGRQGGGLRFFQKIILFRFLPVFGCTWRYLVIFGGIFSFKMGG
jgi:hypothetical protein